ncbi:MAG: 1-deoxy-D-xylulose-5-phosphate reductoisomerase, partial [Clostridia bacterium]|nr:1-deoxy-D-xylulose-5-phosphate reductoisomerase [Clostridia bacterium]
IGKLTFERPDTETFKCLPVCIEAINRGGLYPAAANGANEEAVALFLEEKIAFTDIADLVFEGMASAPKVSAFDLGDIYNTDAAARRRVRNLIKG